MLFRKAMSCDFMYLSMIYEEELIFDFLIQTIENRLLTCQKIILKLVMIKSTTHSLIMKLSLSTMTSLPAFHQNVNVRCGCLITVILLSLLARQIDDQLFISNVKRNLIGIRNTGTMYFTIMQRLHKKDWQLNITGE